MRTCLELPESAISIGWRILWNSNDSRVVYSEVDECQLQEVKNMVIAFRGIPPKLLMADVMSRELSLEYPSTYCLVV